MAAPKRRGNAPIRNDLGQNDDAAETTRLLGAARDDETNTTDEDGGWDGYRDFQDRPWWRRPSVFWLLFPYTIFTVAFGGMIVPKINLFLDLVCKQYFADKAFNDPGFEYEPILLGHENPQCKVPEVTSKLSLFMLAVNLITGVLSVIIVPRLGHLSDRFGRRRLLALASVGGMLNETVTIFAARFPQAVDYRWLLLGAFFDGMTGSFTAGSVLIQSYTSDSTPPSKRAVSMGYVYACLFGGLAIGPLVSGYFAEFTGSLISVFYLALGCHAFFALFMGFVVPESLTRKKMLVAREKHEREKQARLGGLGSLHVASKITNPFTPLSVLWPTGPGTSTKLRINLVALAFADTIAVGSASSVGQVLIIYSEQVFQWSNLETSRFISSLSAARVVVLMGLFPIINYFGRVLPAARRRRATGDASSEKNAGADGLDIWILRVAFVAEVIGCAGFISARSTAFFYSCAMFMALGGLGAATAPAVVTKHVPTERTGQFLGAIGMLHALTRVVGPVLFNGLFAATSKTFPQAFLVLLLGLYSLTLVASFIIRTGVHWDENGAAHEESLSGANNPVERVIISHDTESFAQSEQPVFAP